MRNTEKGWKSLNQDKIAFGLSRSVYWFRFTLSSVNSSEILFELTCPHLDHVCFYHPKKDNTYSKVETGDNYTFSKRDVKDRNFVFNLKARPGNNIYYFRIDSTGSITSEPLLWSKTEFQERKDRELPVLWIYFGLMIAMAVYNLFIFISVREKAYIYYVLFIISWILLELVNNGFSFQYLWPESIWWQNHAILYFINFSLVSTTFFGHSFIGTRDKFPRIYKSWMFLPAVPSAVIIFLIPFFTYNMGLTISFILSGSTIFLYIIFLVYANFKGSWEARYLLLSFLTYLIGVILYIMKTYGFLPDSFLTRYGMQIGSAMLVILFSLGLAQRINILKNELQELNKNLEIKVAERTEELRAANEELQSMNDSLVDLNDKLIESQRIAKINMHMAANVQTTLLPKNPPNDCVWDIAFTFRPVSGVSGDLYDFYLKNGRLEGLSLFDVSGHGIASGLITMIARSIFYRYFNFYRDQPLNRVLENANLELINELGDVQNYITGIILRFNGNKVDYVNAAHTDLIFWRGESEKIGIVNKRDGDIRGHFLGLDTMCGEYETLTFEVKKDDLLLLYTDSLNESKNPEGGQYGSDRIKSSIRNHGKGAAEYILKGLLSDFYAFTGTEKLKDDLTAIVLKRNI